MIRDLIHSDSYNINSYIKFKKVDQDSKSMIRIVDFGLISMHEYAEETHTQDVGNIKYMAPEVDNNQYNTKADIYSLGIILRKLFDIDMDK
jgi:serine/threonine protein kinase